jgi:hypothetical protein
MRSIIFYLTIALFSNCGGQFPEKFMNQKQIEIQYEALSRGFFENILISEAGIHLRIDRNNALQTFYKISKKDWQTCLDLLEEFNPEDLPTLKAPISKRFYDGAAHAVLSIEIDGQKMTTPSFDHGYPPETIKDLTAHVLELKKQCFSKDKRGAQ